MLGSCLQQRPKTFRCELLHPAAMCENICAQWRSGNKMSVTWQNRCWVILLPGLRGHGQRWYLLTLFIPNLNNRPVEAYRTKSLKIGSLANFYNIALTTIRPCTCIDFFLSKNSILKLIKLLDTYESMLRHFSSLLKSSRLDCLHCDFSEYSRL